MNINNYYNDTTEKINAICKNMIDFSLTQKHDESSKRRIRKKRNDVTTQTLLSKKP